MHKPTNLKNNKRVVVQHGELVLTPVDVMPKGATTSHVQYIAAHSETGHNHVIKSDKGIELLTKDNQRYMLVKEVTELFHQKTFDIHETQWLAPGAYEIRERQEYNPFLEIMQRVFD